MNFIAENWWWIVLIIAVIIVVLVVLLILMDRRDKRIMADFKEKVLSVESEQMEDENHTIDKDRVAENAQVSEAVDIKVEEKNFSKTKNTTKPTASTSKVMEIKADFDTDELNGDCFGVRRTTSNGAMASVGDEYVPVWCNTVPLYADEIEQLPNGKIVTSGAQPTCAELALDGYVAIQVGKCYGKYYDPYKYYIQCGTGDLLPERIIVLNGADYTMPSGDAPVDIDAANDIFDKMESVSQTQRSKYFKDN